MFRLQISPTTFIKPQAMKAVTKSIAAAVLVTSFTTPASALMVPQRDVPGFSGGSSAGSAAGLNQRVARNIIRTSGQAGRVLALDNFCQRHADQCRPRRGSLQTDGNGAVVVSQRVLSQVDRVHSSVNRSMTARYDHDIHGVADVWNIRARVGDCEDFALEKRRQLLARGWPSSALVLAIGRLPSGEGHAVLIVRTTGGDLVLDNLESEVLPLERSRMRLHSTMSFDNPALFKRARSVRA